MVYDARRTDGIPGVGGAQDDTGQVAAPSILVPLCEEHDVEGLQDDREVQAEGEVADVAPHITAFGA